MLNEYCWISPKCSLERFISLYFFEISAIVINFIQLAIIIIIICTLPKEYRKNLMKTVAIKAILYSVVLLVSYLPGLVFRFIEMFSQVHNTTLRIVHLIISRLYFVFLTILFIYDENLIVLYRNTALVYKERMLSYFKKYESIN
jgi:hypothetical protein